MTSDEKRGRPRRCRRSVKGDPRPKTLSPKALQRWLREERQESEPGASLERPVTRGDCLGLPRPCPFVGCRHHLYLDVKPTGAITLCWPHLAPWEIPESCALDVAECGEHTLDEVGELLNVSQERVRKIEMLALDRLRAEHGRTLAAHLPARRGAATPEPEADRPTLAASNSPEDAPELTVLPREEVC